MGFAPFRKSRASIAGDPRDQEDLKDQEDPQGQEDEKVRIIDSAGGAYEVPFSLCRSFSVSRKVPSTGLHFYWCCEMTLTAVSQNFEKILRKKIYPVDKAESKRYYDFFSEYDSRQGGYTLKPHVMSREDGTRIPPPKWKELIQPGRTVQVSFIDQELTGKFRSQYGGRHKRRSWLVNPR